jgi:hypothetical protein
MAKSVLLNNLKQKYKNEIEIHKTNIKIFLNSPQGVADHINFAETIEKELEAVAQASDMLEALELVE